MTKSTMTNDFAESGPTTVDGESEGAQISTEGTHFVLMLS